MNQSDASVTPGNEGLIRSRRQIGVNLFQGFTMQHGSMLFDIDKTPGTSGPTTSQDHAECDKTHQGGRIVKVTARQVRQLIAHQEYRCNLTGWSLTPETASVDHVVPLKNGGDHAIENLQVVHKSINAAKGTMSQAEFIQMCRAVVEWTQNRGDSDRST